MTQAAQESDGLTIALCRCSAQGHGLAVDLFGSVRVMAGINDRGGLFKINDSMIPR